MLVTSGHRTCSVARLVTLELLERRDASQPDVISITDAMAGSDYTLRVADNAPGFAVDGILPNALINGLRIFESVVSGFLGAYCRRDHDP